MTELINQLITEVFVEQPMVLPGSAYQLQRCLCHSPGYTGTASYTSQGQRQAGLSSDMQGQAGTDTENRDREGADTHRFDKKGNYVKIQKK